MAFRIALFDVVIINISSDKAYSTVIVFIGMFLYLIVFPSYVPVWKFAVAEPPIVDKMSDLRSLTIVFSQILNADLIFTGSEPFNAIPNLGPEHDADVFFAFVHSSASNVFPPNAKTSKSPENSRLTETGIFNFSIFATALISAYGLMLSGMSVVVSPAVCAGDCTTNLTNSSALTIPLKSERDSVPTVSVLAYERIAVGSSGAVWTGVTDPVVPSGRSGWTA